MLVELDLFLVELALPLDQLEQLCSGKHDALVEVLRKEVASPVFFHFEHFFLLFFEAWVFKLLLFILGLNLRQFVFDLLFTKLLIGLNFFMVGNQVLNLLYFEDDSDLELVHL